MKLAYSLFFLLSASLMAQTATLRGVVTDETGAVIPSAKVTANGPNGARSAATANDGSYTLAGLPQGDYTVEASTAGLVLPEPVRIALSAGARTLNLQLKLAATRQEITVQENDAAVSTDAASNASAVTIKGSDLDALSDDPEDLQSDLQALAGPSAGPSGGQIFIDGFSGGQLPPKESIREIRINQNPFSPEYDRIGLGRIEILTKPGADQLRGAVSYNYMGDFWNSRNPYAAQKAPLQLNEFRGNLSGPLNHRASFTLDVSRESIDNGSIVNAVTLDPKTLAITPFTAVPVTPQRRTLVSPRLDYQLSSNNTLTLRYTFSHSDIRDAGIGSFDLLSRGFHTPSTNQTAQATDTAVFGASVNETRFQYSRYATEAIPNVQSPTIQVLGSFNGGGAQTGHGFYTQKSYELQNYTTTIHGSHTVKFGVRARLQSIDSVSPQNYNGTFTFGGGLNGIESIERYRRTLLFQQLGYTPDQIRAMGGGATQFSITAGIPEISGNQIDVGAFVGDDWKVRPNFTVNLGVRYEAQGNIDDWRDWAPRIGLAWAPGGSGKKQPRTVLRAGFGMFYDRFALNNTLTARRFNGVLERQYVVTNPEFFPVIPAISALGALQSTQVIQRVDSNLHAPYTLQSAFTVERQLPRGSTLAVTYTGSRGLHVLRSLDINAPLPGTYDPSVPGSGVFPLGNLNPLFLMTSSGVYNQHQVTVNMNARVNRNISLTGSYAWNHARSNTDGLGTYPANPYNYTGEYGPAATDMRHTVNINGTINTKWDIRLSPFLNFQSGAPFDITTGSDLYGTTLFNARPGITTEPNKPGLVPTAYGLLDPNPAPGERILSRNFGRGPAQIWVNFRIAKTFGFGPERGGGSGGQGGGPFGGNPTTNRRYNMSISLSARNLLNHTNPGPIIGNIASPLFGQANQMGGGGFGPGLGPGGGAGFGGIGFGGFAENANNRRLEMQVRFTF
jgi:carboxypeptidase family protein